MIELNPTVRGINDKKLEVAVSNQRLVQREKRFVLALAADHRNEFTGKKQRYAMSLPQVSWLTSRSVSVDFFAADQRLEFRHRQEHAVGLRIDQG